MAATTETIWMIFFAIMGGASLADRPRADAFQVRQRGEQRIGDVIDEGHPLPCHQLGLDLPAVAGPHQHGAGADRTRRREIARLVPDQNGAREIEIQVVRGRQQHAWARLATGAVLIGVMGAEVPSIDVGRSPRQDAGHGPIDRLVGRNPVHAPPDAGLIGDHHDGNLPAIDRGDGLSGPRDHDQILGVVQVLALFVQHPVPVEQQAWSQASPPRPRTSCAPPTGTTHDRW
jgi:hypothetical protein